MKTTRLTLPWLALLALPAFAQTLSPAPAAGLWETQSKFTINGQDLGALMKRSMADALKGMPADQRAMAEQMMGGMGGMGGSQQECLSAAEAARRSDARAVLADLQKDAPQCRYEPVKVGGATLAFKGRCSDPEGFTGDVAGELTMGSAKAWTGRWSGKGRMAGEMGEMPELKIGADGRVEMAWSGSGRWVSAACGKVKPQ